MIITALKQQQKNPERVSVYVDSKYSFSLSLDEVVAERLKKGLEVNNERLSLLKKRSAEGKLRAQALRWVLLRPHSVHELQQYLYKKRVAPELSSLIIEEFIAKGYVNDLSFARQWVENRRRSKLRSSRQLQAELRSKGISSEIIRQLLQEEHAETEETALTLLIAKKQRQLRYKTNPEKLMQYLVKQGFSYDLVRKQLHSLDD